MDIEAREDKQDKLYKFVLPVDISMPSAAEIAKTTAKVEESREETEVLIESLAQQQQEEKGTKERLKVQNTSKIKKKAKKHKKKCGVIGGFFKLIGLSIFSLILMSVITISILASVVTIYILQFREEVPIDIDIDSRDLAYTTFIYGKDKEGNQVELQRISREANRIPVEIEQIPQHVRDAFVYVEDERFYEHAGVDWKRTFGAVLNELSGGMLYGSRQGGSTITQQLVKNITGDEEPTWDRKLREIFRAADLEKYRPKDDILEGYLNCIGFGGNTCGIQAASLKYFGKDVSELDLAEAACLAAIPKSPEVLNPFADREANEERRQVVLDLMFKNAAISEKEYINASIEELQFRDYEKEREEGKSTEIQNWYIDMVIRDITEDFEELYGITSEEASNLLYNGGYKIYIPMDIEMQAALEAKYADYTTFSDKVLNDPPDSAFIVIDYKGNIKAVVGGVGKKAGSNVWNRATMSPRQAGSSIKPLAGYGYSIEHDLITWSTRVQDLPLDIVDYNAPGGTRKWPTNYSSTSRNNVWSGNSYFIYEALQRSLNTVSARLVQGAQPANIFNMLQNRFRFSTLSVYDADLAPLAVGALTDGVYLRELVGAYAVFGNEGKYLEPVSYNSVVDRNGTVVLENKYMPIQAIGEDTAWIMNRMMKTVVEGPHGTGKLAKLDTVEVVGKTGTSQDWRDNLFICCTPDYVSGVWYGYDDMRSVPSGTYYGSAQLWKNIFGDIADACENKTFKPSDEVEEHVFCSNTGLIAGEYCPAFNTGYYKKSNLPAVCKLCGGNSEELGDNNAELLGVEQGNETGEDVIADNEVQEDTEEIVTQNVSESDSVVDILDTLI